MKDITADQLRKLYIDFFVSKGHKQISGASLIPENDPTVLFTTAGMHPLVPYILGAEHPAGTRLTDYQKCIRTGDIDSVGDPHHLTFFEMLGNWSLGDYFKKEMIGYSFEFLTKVLGIPVDRLSVTVFEGDAEVPRDEEAAARWIELGIDPSHVYFMPREDNWWGPAGETGPCGPDSEMFFDTGRPACGPDCKPGCKCGKYFEIWNDVFMQYRKEADGTYHEMARKCIDTGMGIERTVAVLQGKKSVYETEVFQPIIRRIEELSGRKYGENEDDDISIRIISDHIRTSVFILGDQKAIAPSNVGQGYILRRLIRRAVRHGKKIGIDHAFLSGLADVVLSLYSAPYPELEEHREFIHEELLKEEEKFSQTLTKGEKEFEKMLPNLMKGNSRVISGRLAFKLYDTYGFPIELTTELAAEHGFTVDIDGFHAAFEKHQELSRAGAEQQFKAYGNCAIDGSDGDGADVVYLSRADFAGTFPNATLGNRTGSAVSSFTNMAYDGYGDVAMPATETVSIHFDVDSRANSAEIYDASKLSSQNLLEIARSVIRGSETTAISFPYDWYWLSR